MGLIVNILIRLGFLYFLGEVLLFPDDPRFVDKAIPIRNVIVVLSLSLLFPFLYFFKRKKEQYPFWIDNLYLSLFWVDMAGNSFNLYDRFYYFDLFPHFHGAGVVAIVFLRAFKLPILSAIGAATIIHVLLEVQEYYTDVLFDTHNVRSTSDTINDLTVGILGAAFYVLLYLILTTKRKFPLKL